jgi:hypothetical protein
LKTKAKSIIVHIAHPIKVPGTTRFIKHLANQIGDGQLCANVPEWVKKAARGHIDLNAATAKRKTEARN